VFETLLPSRLLTPMHVNLPYCVYNLFPEDETTRFEICRRHQKLNIKLENYAFRWFVLCNYIAMHGTKNIKFKDNIFSVFYFKSNKIC